ncbi:MAG: hypothetical protein ACYDDF_09835 [Thermoplasmatota archaeon]
MCEDAAKGPMPGPWCNEEPTYWDVSEEPDCQQNGRPLRRAHAAYRIIAEADEIVRSLGADPEHHPMFDREGAAIFWDARANLAKSDADVRAVTYGDLTHYMRGAWLLLRSPTQMATAVRILAHSKLAGGKRRPFTMKHAAGVLRQTNQGALKPLIESLVFLGLLVPQKLGTGGGYALRPSQAALKPYDPDEPKAREMSSKIERALLSQRPALDALVLLEIQSALTDHLEHAYLQRMIPPWTWAIWRIRDEENVSPSIVGLLLPMQPPPTVRKHPLIRLRA